MSELLTASFLSAFIIACISGAIPLLLASVGETIGEQSGVLNLGIEGMMLIGAYTGYVCAIASHSIWIGMLGGAIGGIAISLVLMVLNVWLGLNQIVLGIAITIAGGGITSVLYHNTYGQSQPSIPPDRWQLPGLSAIPAVGSSIFSQSGVFWVSILLAVAVAFLLSRTNWGLSIRAAGQQPSSLDAAGGSVMKTRSQAVLLGGFFSGIGGAYLSLLSTGAFTPFMTAGVGYIAIVVTMLSRGRIWVVAAISTLYGFTQALGTALQLGGISIPPQIISMLPYIVVMIVLLIFARSVYISPVLGAPYTRGAR
ncbi:ABC transporter permease [Leifsonia shinshuensis]|uniref:ABC transporter permease n=1 Tax=Leifsonia shinshuensis TaxID=150026 RepID=UPI001F50B070|nr:ABC transporter permease [Leifsonia shinshuensis]MCI0156468.1 ABC transporter permease [Leifsonia shinshuensis]